MEQITVRVAEDTLEELDELAEESNQSRAEVIRDVLNSRTDSSEVEQLRDEIEHLENQVERLQRTNLKILEERDHSTELEVYVSDRKEWEQASWLTRQKWKLFGKD